MKRNNFNDTEINTDDNKVIKEEIKKQPELLDVWVKKIFIWLCVGLTVLNLGKAFVVDAIPVWLARFNVLDIQYFDEMDKDAYYKQMDNFLSQNFKSGSNKRILIKSQQVKGFDIKKDTLSFKNIGSYNSPNGCCFGISMLEKQLFENTLEKKKEDKGYTYYDVSFLEKSSLHKYKMDSTSIDSVYKKKPSVSEKFVPSTSKRVDINAEKIIKKAHELMISNNFDSFSDVKDSNVNEILRAVNYFQTNILTFKNSFYIQPVYFTKDNGIGLTVEYFRTLLHVQNKKSKLYMGIDPKSITEFIDNNKTVVIGLSSKIAGHAVLGYKYEEYPDMVKVYVADSNIPLYNDGQHEELDKQIENTFIIFKKIDDDWQFKYEPEINGETLYKGVYNSYIPESMVTLYK